MVVQGRGNHHVFCKKNYQKNERMHVDSKQKMNKSLYWKVFTVFLKPESVRNLILNLLLDSYSTGN
jgi:hypothetical protein